VRIRAHLEHLLGQAAGATGGPWQSFGPSHVGTVGGVETGGLVAITWDRAGMETGDNAEFIAAARTAVPELAGALLEVLDWLVELTDDPEPVRASRVARSGLELLDSKTLSPAPPADLPTRLIGLLRRAGELARLLPETERSQAFTEGWRGWSRTALELALQGATEHIVAAREVVPDAGDGG
jgi:hypothetical protein